MLDESPPAPAASATSSLADAPWPTAAKQPTSGQNSQPNHGSQTSRQPCKRPPAEPSIRLLQHYQKDWQRLHQQNEENLQRLDEAAQLSGQLLRFCNRRSTAMDRLLQAQSQLTQIESSMDELHVDLGRLQANLGRVEQLVDRLDRQRLEQAVDRLDFASELRYGQETERRQAEFELAKQQLAKEHIQRGRDWERRQLAKTEEQRRLFQKAFEQELDEYRRTGRLGKPTRLTAESEPALAEEPAEDAEEVVEVEELSELDAVEEVEEVLEVEHADEGEEVKEEEEEEEVAKVNLPNGIKAAVKLEQVQVEPDELDRLALLDFLDKS